MRRGAGRAGTAANVVIFVAASRVLLAIAHRIASFVAEQRLGGPAAPRLLVALGLGLFVAFAGYGILVARWRGRPWAEGFWLGLGLGPIGVLVEALLPEPPPPTPPADDGGERPW